MSPFLNLNNRDFVKGLAMFVIAAIATAIAQMVNAPGFDFGAFKWSELIRIAVVATLAYLGKNLATGEDGKMFGKI